MASEVFLLHLGDCYPSLPRHVTEKFVADFEQALTLAFLRDERLMGGRLHTGLQLLSRASSAAQIQARAQIGANNLETHARECLEREIAKRQRNGEIPRHVHHAEIRSWIWQVEIGPYPGPVPPAFEDERIAIIIAALVAYYLRKRENDQGRERPA